MHPVQLRDGGLDPSRAAGVTTPNSAKWPRKALISMVRCRTRRLRTLCSISTAC